MKAALFGLGVLLAAASPAAAQTGDGNEATSPSHQEVGDLGVEIFERDRAAWVATDAMLAAVEDPQGRGIAGWVTEPSDGGWTVTFVGDRDGAIVPIYQARTLGSAVTSGQVLPPDAPPVSWALSRQFEARQAAIPTIEGICSPSVNTVVIPLGDSSAPAAYDVYFLSATTEPGVIVAGGHIRRRVSADDLSVIEREAFSASCLSIPAPAPEEGAQVAGISMTNAVASEPSEIHVFLSLSHGLPVYVVTTSNGKLWSVDGATITHVGEVDSANP